MRWRPASWRTGASDIVRASQSRWPNPALVLCHRVRLYKRGDTIANDVRDRKLKREYDNLSELSQFIYWSSIGREGAYHFQELLKQKKMAEQLRESVAEGLSVEKAQKMIKSSIEAQQKANAAKAASSRSRGQARYPRSRVSGRSTRGRGARGRGRGGRSGRAARGGRSGRGRSSLASKTVSIASASVP